MIRMVDVRVPTASYIHVGEVLASGQLAQGAYVDALESFFSVTGNAVAVNSGTAALALALATVAEPGETVAVPGFTFAGTVNAVLAAGCNPVLVDVGSDLLLDPAKIPDDVDVVMPVHLYGQKASTNYPRCVEDAAQAVGHAITHGAFSLYATKTLYAGEGGVFFTHDPDAADQARTYANQGMRARYEHERPGFNYRLTDIQAAVALGQIPFLEATLLARRRHAEYLWEQFESLPVGLPNPFEHSWHQFTVRIRNRDQVKERMLLEGVETAVHYPHALSEFPWLEGDCPEAEQAAREVLSLPIHEHLTDGQVERIAEVFRSCVSD